VDMTTGKNIMPIMFVRPKTLKVYDINQILKEKVVEITNTIEKVMEVLTDFGAITSGNSTAPDDKTPEFPDASYQVIYSNKYTLDTKDRNKMAFYYVQGGTVINDNMYVVVESYGESRIVQTNLNTGKTTMLEGKFGRLSGIAQEAAQPTPLGHANSVAGVALTDGTIMLWVAKMDTPGIAQVKIANGKATIVKQIKVVDTTGKARQVASLNIESFDGTNIALGTHAIYSG
ncbi:hypothetical protein, partial [Periweissella ghanensis]